VQIKNRLYGGGRFQFQFSIHTTDIELRDMLIPVRKWSFEQMADYGERFYCTGDRKITLNFALAEGMPVQPEVLLEYFDPARYLIKITPVNPTCRAVQHGLSTQIDPYRPETGRAVANSLSKVGYDVIVSIGEAEENQIGSNCGQYVLKYIETGQTLKDGYTYEVKPLAESTEVMVD
jgi:23S rRNA (adenine2503-C2)-methyltransferase